MDRAKTSLDYTFLAAFEPRAARPRTSVVYHLSLLLAATVLVLRVGSLKPAGV